MAKHSSAGSGTGKWSAGEHRLFEEGVRLFGWGKWMQIAEMIPTRTKTQVKSHAQKVQKRIQRGKQPANVTPPLATKAASKTRSKSVKGADESKKIYHHDASNMNISSDQAFKKSNDGILLEILSSHDSNASKNASSHPKSKSSGSSKRVSSHGEGAIIPNIDGKNEGVIGIPVLSMSSGSSETVSSRVEGFVAANLDGIGEEMSNIPTVLHALKRANSATSRVVDLVERGFTFSNVDVTGEEVVVIPTSLNVFKRENNDNVASLKADGVKELSSARMSQTGSPPISSDKLGQGASDKDMDDIMFKDTFRGFPSNYDVLCGDEQGCLEHIGNRRFRVMIKMRLHRYEPYFVATFLPSVTDREIRMQEFFDDVLQTLSSCTPPCRFLVPLDTAATVGTWGVLDDVRARRKIREAFHECMIESVGVPV